MRKKYGVYYLFTLISSNRRCKYYHEDVLRRVNYGKCVSGFIRGVNLEYRLGPSQTPINLTHTACNATAQFLFNLAQPVINCTCLSSVEVYAPRIADPEPFCSRWIALYVCIPNSQDLSLIPQYMHIRCFSINLPDSSPSCEHLNFGLNTQVL